jgi:hypothetical protein
MMQVAVDQLFNDDLALSYEETCAAHQVPLPYVAIDFDSWIIEVIDLDQISHGLAAPTLYVRH